MEDPNLIATLIPVDDPILAEKAFCHDKNKNRYLPPAPRLAESPSISSREATPAQEQPNDDSCKYDFTHRLQLTFDVKPKDASKGYSFGTDSGKCDVVLGHRGARGTSGLHFCITFDDTIDKERHLILRDWSTNGTAVSYNGQAEKEVRHHFNWILDLKKEEGKWEIKVHARGLRFKVELASHETCKAEYDKKVKNFLENSGPALPLIDELGINSHTTTEQALTPRRLPIYIRERTLGSGSFGRVDKVINVSTGAIYARKEFFEPQWGKGKELRRQQKEDWLNRVHREVRIMEENPHENTVQVVHFREDPLPFFVMPYFPLGNLEDLHRESPIAVEETVGLFAQALNALRYLHARGVAHRDLKPENILVESRSPLNIQLADFGLANDTPDLETFCGTRKYTAPEVYLGRKYTASVDLWSLGVIILQFMYGLPTAPRERHGRQKNPISRLQQWGLNWCRCIIEYANDWESDKLIDLLTTGMLRIRPEERLSASACWTKGCDLGIFEVHSLDSGTVTPTRQTAPRSGMSNDDGSTTIILGALWDKDEDSDHDGDDRTGQCPPDRISRIPGSRNPRDPSSPGNGDGPGSRLGGQGHFQSHVDGSLQSSADLLFPLLEARSTYAGGYKRQRSPAVDSANRRIILRTRTGLNVDHQKLISQRLLSRTLWGSRTGG